MLAQNIAPLGPAGIASTSAGPGAGQRAGSDARSSDGAPQTLYSLRAATAEDAAFLESLYRSSRLSEVSAWGWSGAQVDAFLQMQGQMEQRARASQYPDADHRIVVVAGRPVGRLLVDRTSERTLVVDIGLLPEVQGLGIGTAMLGALIREAETRVAPIVLRVRRDNRAARLYRKLGFAVTSEDEMQVTMTFCPTSRSSAPSGPPGGNHV